jgi:hypothetical protein
MANICFIATYPDGRKEHIWAPNYYDACKQAGPNASVAITQSYLGGSGTYMNLPDGSHDYSCR